MAPSPQTLSVEARRTVAAWAADCAEQVLAVYEDVVPGDGRVWAAIEQARAFAGGGLEVQEAIRRRGGDAGGAGRDAPTPAARAAACAAEQAAAVAHMGAHALGAAGYAAKAAALATGAEHVDVRRQLEAMTAAVAEVLRALPMLGEDRAGPLSAGRLSGGLVGEAIRAIQAELRA